MLLKCQVWPRIHALFECVCLQTLKRFLQQAKIYYWHVMTIRLKEERKFNTSRMWFLFSFFFFRWNHYFLISTLSTEFNTWRKHVSTQHFILLTSVCVCLCAMRLNRFIIRIKERMFFSISLLHEIDTKNEATIHSLNCLMFISFLFRCLLRFLLVFIFFFFFNYHVIDFGFQRSRLESEINQTENVWENKKSRLTPLFSIHCIPW